MILDTTAHLKANGREVVYDAEHFFDGYKDNPEHALGTLEAAKEGGAAIVVLCDTNGGTLPHEVSEITKVVMKRLAMPVGIHTHDDAGFGVANAIASFQAGAVQIQGTINGYGERVGNCNLTTVIPSLQLKLGVPVVPDLTRFDGVESLRRRSRESPSPSPGSVRRSGSVCPQGGMHVNAVEKLAKTYEHIEPELVGNRQRILISELSGQSNVLLKASELGALPGEGGREAKALLKQLKEMEEDGYEFEAAEASFELLIRKALKTYDPLFLLREYRCNFRRIRDSGNGEPLETCEATVKLEVGGNCHYTVDEGDGPVNALDAALRKALEVDYPEIRNIRLTDYRVRIIDSKLGTAAKTRVLIDSTDGVDTWSTVGVSYNIIRASWLALVDSIEYYLLRFREEKKTKKRK